MLFLLSVLSSDCMYYCLEDVFLGYNTLHILYQLIGFIHFFILQVVDDKIESGFRDDIDQRRKDLQGVFSSSENN